MRHARLELRHISVRIAAIASPGDSEASGWNELPQGERFKVIPHPGQRDTVVREVGR